ncbi:MAG: hypothetical protein V3V08_11265 [Nannocystaceae bacterium]
MQPISEPVARKNTTSSIAYESDARSDGGGEYRHPLLQKHNPRLIEAWRDVRNGRGTATTTIAWGGHASQHEENGDVQKFSGLTELSHRQVSPEEIARARLAKEAHGSGSPHRPQPTDSKIGRKLEPVLADSNDDDEHSVIVTVHLTPGMCQHV